MIALLLQLLKVAKDVGAFGIRIVVKAIRVRGFLMEAFRFRNAVSTHRSEKKSSNLRQLSIMVLGLSGTR